MNNIDRNKTDLNKRRNYPTANEALDLEYGKVGTTSRGKFTVQAYAY